jgi:hypothetical protein
MFLIDITQDKGDFYMMKLNKDTGEITTFIGDSGKFYLSGLPLSSSGSTNVYFSVYNDKDDILNEQEYTATVSGTLTMFIPAEFTDVLTIPKNEDSAEYYYGIKVAYYDVDGNRIESTCTIGTHKEDEPTLFTVYPKRTEGGKTPDPDTEEETTEETNE